MRKTLNLQTPAPSFPPVFSFFLSFPRCSLKEPQFIHVAGEERENIAPCFQPQRTAIAGVN